MLYDYLGGMADTVPAFNVFRYITFRTGGAMVTALLISFLFGPRIIALLRARQRHGQPIREDGPQTHIIQKQGTPTMGGFLILVGLVPSVVLWADWSNRYVWIVLFVTLGFGAVGFADDYLKVSKISPKGVPGRVKLILEFIIAILAMWALVLSASEPLQTALTVPFFKTLLIQLGGFFFLFGALVIVGSSNAVNLTDGLDGLAIVPVMIAAASLGLIVYLVGNAVFADYLQIHFVPGTGELACTRCGAGCDFDRSKTRTGPCNHWRALRARSRIGHRAGCVFQAHRQARLPDGAASSSFRTEGLGGTDHRRALLDHLGCARDGGPRNVKIEVNE